MATFFNTLWIDTSKSPRFSLVESGSITPTKMSSIIAGDNINLFIRFTNNGSLDSRINGVVGLNLTGSIGLYNTTYASSSNWYNSSSYGFTGSINTNTAQMLAAVGTDPSITCNFSISSKNADGKITYLLTPVEVYNPIN